MNQAELDPVGRILADAYQDTWTQSRIFTAEYGHPLSVAARAQYLRSIAQARFLESDRYDLAADYVEYGRVEFVDLETGRMYLLRSASAVIIERARAQEPLFDPDRYLPKSKVLLAVYSFSKDGASLSLAGTRHVANRRRLAISGKPAFIGAWAFGAPDGDDPPFDQSEADAFDELGNLDMDESGEEGAED